MKKIKKMKKLKLTNHEEYWEARAREIFEYVDRKDIDFFAELEKTYRNEAVRLQKSLFDFYAKYAEDHELTYQDATKRLRGEDLSDYVDNATLYREQAEKDPELLKRLNQQYASARAIRIEALQLEAIHRLGVLTGALHKSFEKYLFNVAEYAYRKAMGGRTGAVNRPAFEEIVKTPFNGRNYSEQLWGNTDSLAQKLKEVFKQGFIRGDSPQDMAREIRKEFNVARSRAETLVRTDATAVINRATIKRYQKAGLEYYRILVVLDDRTTQICRRIAQEDKLYKLEDAQVGVNMPPFHYNCRSTIMPDAEEIGEEGSSD
ncbi:minor capsid protein [Streptococcus parasanguinis]|uniref:minor capsid protein n=1 Tax=Streptococcus parasanguinis TaxID=1318 RepID=UPI0020018C26|nr:minor capsid protein [Streptococcus parasanguinis]